MQTAIRVWKKSQLLAEVVSIGLFVALMCLSARVMLPLVPVPVTLQVLVVLLSGLILGPYRAGMVQVMYLGMIALGVPVTAYGLAAPAVFLGPTAGYLIAFLPAAFLTGFIKEQLEGKRIASIAAVLIGILAIYLLGVTWLAVWLHSFRNALTYGLIIFLAIDLAKAVLAIAIANRLHFPSR